MTEAGIFTHLLRLPALAGGTGRSANAAIRVLEECRLQVEKIASPVPTYGARASLANLILAEGG